MQGKVGVHNHSIDLPREAGSMDSSGTFGRILIFRMNLQFMLFLELPLPRHKTPPLPRPCFRKDRKHPDSIRLKFHCVERTKRAKRSSSSRTARIGKWYPSHSRSTHMLSLCSSKLAKVPSFDFSAKQNHVTGSSQAEIYLGCIPFFF